MENKSDLTNFAATLLEAFDLIKEDTMSPSVKWLTDEIKCKAGGKIQKAFLFHADAVPRYVVNKNPDIFSRVRENTSIEIEVNAVKTAITPVCFASMFSGAYPEFNGVPKYVKPILTDTLIQPSISVKTFVDVLAENGYKVAVVTCSNGCIASMLYGRGEDLYIVPDDNDEAMFNKACEVLESDKYDVIMLYQLSYDYQMHSTGPESTEAINVLDTLTKRYDMICKKVKNIWQDKKYLTVFNSDHGSYKTEKGGGHGENIPEDMEMMWFFGTNENR